jgi:putative intracellular protease/amidase
MKKVLIPLTNHAFLGTTDEANGTYAPELTHVLHVLQAANIDYELASAAGGVAPIYGTDIEDDDINDTCLADATFQNRINNTVPFSQVNMTHYQAVFYPGGFGLLSDLAENTEMAALSAAHYEAGGILAAVCHGPGALLPITLSSGESLLASKTVTGFTREEEVDYGTIDKVPFELEERLARSAKQYQKTQPWLPLVVQSDRVITGQNPGSASAVGEALVNALTAS